MSGRNQHYIPRAVLRGFLSRRTKRDEYVWVARRGGAIFEGNLEGVAAQRDFYSDPPEGDEQTLDRTITDYEDRLAALLAELRALAPGDDAPPAVAAEVLAHLAPRAANLRTFFLEAFRKLLEGAGQVLADREHVAGLIGVHELAPNDLFRTKVLDDLRPQFTALGIAAPAEVLDRFVFALVRENLEVFLEEQRPLIEHGLRLLDDGAPEQVRTSHSQVLSKSLVVQARAEDLETYRWRIVAAPEGGAILPDCVALAYLADAEPLPYIMSDRGKALHIVMPLTPDRLLVGSRQGEDSLSLVDFNAQASACSDVLIVARAREGLSGLQPLIGSRPGAYVEKMVGEALGSSVPSVHAHGSGPASLDPSGFSFELSLPDWGDGQTAEALRDLLQLVLGKLTAMMPLDRLEGITFAIDLPAAVGALEPGPDGAPPLEVSAEAVAYTPVVERVDGLKARVFMHANLGHALIGGTEPENAQFALHVLVHELAQVALLTEIETAFPGVLLAPALSEHYARLFHHAIPAIWQYYAARMSAGFGADDKIEARCVAQLSGLWPQLQSDLEAAAVGYARTGRVDQRYETGLASAKALLTACADLLGHRHGCDREGLTMGDPVAELLAQLELTRWYQLLERDLDRLWNRRGAWTAFTEFTDFTLHVDRLLWQFGMASWPTDQGTWVQFAPSTDAARS